MRPRGGEGESKPRFGGGNAKRRGIGASGVAFLSVAAMGCVETVQLLEWLPVFEPRLTARVFVAHGISIGGYVGANLARPGEAQGGLTLGFHTRGLDGVGSR